MTDKKIIKMDAKQKRPVEIRRKNFHDCKHFPVIVDERLRTVECSRCGKQLDPVQILIEMATRYRQMDYKLMQMKEYEEKQERQRQKQRERYEKKKKKRKERQ